MGRMLIERRRNTFITTVRLHETIFMERRASWFYRLLRPCMEIASRTQRGIEKFPSLWWFFPLLQASPTSSSSFFSLAAFLLKENKGDKKVFRNWWFWAPRRSCRLVISWVEVKSRKLWLFFYFTPPWPWIKYKLAFVFFICSDHWKCDRGRGTGND